ncbi:MAG: hypothetical protein IIA65_05385 [Planctomycetes bacterium]|nr:hypothetical protein [Planctomycetota bacterium]
MTSNTLLTPGRNKLVLLFLIAVVLPSSVLIMLTWSMIGQQQELGEKRLADERRRLATEIGQKLLVHLENIKLREVSATAGGEESLNTLEYSSGAVVLTALADGERLMLPWEANQTGNASPDNPAFFETMRRAEEEEFSRGRFAQANTLYMECIEAAQLPAQQTTARLAWARVLAKSGEKDNSLAEYRGILEVDSEIIDEYGMPLCLYAANPLIEKGDSFDRILDVLAGQLSAARWFSPAEAYMIRDIVKRLMASGPEVESQRLAVDETHRSIRERIHKQELALALRQDFPRLASTPQWNNSQMASKSVWLAYGEKPLLIGLAPALPGERRLLIAVNGQDIWQTIIAGTPYAEASLAHAAMNGTPAPDGETLGSSFPGLTMLFSAEAGASPWEDGGLQRSFYWLALSVVLCVTLFGAYFLWRDVTRELRLAAMRSQFIASVSHELKTPLTAIRIFAETLRLGRSKDAKTRSEYLDTIVNESHRLTRLLNNVLDFSKIEKGKKSYRKELSKVSDIIKAAADATQYPMTQHGFDLTVSIEDDATEICADRDAIEQALLNLLSNAMKYSGESRAIELKAHCEDDFVVFAVKDKGIGIEAAEHTRIFEKFHRVTSKENERIPGTGLGLALVAHTVEAHDGRIEVQSRPGEGSTFSIYLPLGNNA